MHSVYNFGSDRRTLSWDASYIPVDQKKNKTVAVWEPLIHTTPERGSSFLPSLHSAEQIRRRRSRQFISSS